MGFKMEYIGACALLGRLSSKLYSGGWKTAEDLACVEAALNDLVKKFPGEFKVVKTIPAGFSLESVK